MWNDKISYYPEPDKYGRSKIKNGLYFVNFATKSDVINLTGVNTHDFDGKKWFN